MSFLYEYAIFLAAAVIAVPVSRWLGFGAVLGYLAAGVIMGPYVLGVFHDGEEILHIAEFGIVILLFIIGLELRPTRLWVMRRQVIGLGMAQMGGTAALLILAASFFTSVREAIIVGLGLGMSSTALAIQILAERNQMTTRQGRAAFGILLFQDLSVIPILAIIPLLAGGGDTQMTLTDVLVAFGALGLLIFGGRFALRYLFGFVARVQTPEIFTALGLLTVIGSALLMESAGLSMALGAFIAGVLLSESEFRHALEAEVEPFKGLLLGLFFMAVGMLANLGLLVETPVAVLGIAFGLVAVKLAILYGLGRLSKLNGHNSLMLAITLCQGGEFAFVIFNEAILHGALPRAYSELLVLSVTISMALTPILFLIGDRLEARLEKPVQDLSGVDEPDDEHPRVIIAGFGRIGQMVGRILRARDIPFVGLDINAQRIKLVSSFGNPGFYGDSSRPEVLRAAGVMDADLLIVAIRDMTVSVKLVEMVNSTFPHIDIYARAVTREHAYRLMDAGAKFVERDTFRASLEIGRATLEKLGMPDFETDRTISMFAEHDVRALHDHYAIKDDWEKRRILSRKSADELVELLKKDAESDTLG